MYTLLNGAKKNMGDFLIWEKAQELIALHTGKAEHLQFKYWEPLDDHLEAINRTEALIFCGGPAYSARFHPQLYPLTQRLSDITVPIIPLGIGWAGTVTPHWWRRPTIEPDRFTFTPESLAALRRIHASCTVSSVRDEVTRGILHRHGIENVVMTSCPVLFDVPSLGKPFATPTAIRRIVFTTNQHGDFNPQCITAMRRVRALFPSAEFLVSFHRGVEPDALTTWRAARAMRQLRRVAARLGAEVLDAAYSTAVTERYRQCDLHVGFRLHAHVFFLSLRKPTFLLHEDGRGVAFSEAIGLDDVSALEPDPAGRLAAAIEREAGNGFSRFDGVAARIDRFYERMKQFLATLP